MQVHYVYEYGESNSDMTSNQNAYKRLPGLLYQVETSLYTSVWCNWKGSFTGEEDPDQQHCSVSGSLALCCW